MPVKAWGSITHNAGISTELMQEMSVYATTTLLPMNTRSFMTTNGIALRQRILTSTLLLDNAKQPFRTQRLMQDGVEAMFSS